MDKLKYAGPVLGVILTFGLIWFMGCATTGNTTQAETEVDDVADIDELLGLTDSRGAEGEEDKEISEDDVLRLLGVQEESEPAIPQQRTVDNKSSLENQVRQLEGERNALDQKEQELRNKVTRQESTIADLQKQPARGVESIQTKTASTDGVSTFRVLYQEAYQSYMSRRYRESIQKFEDLLGTNSKHTLSDNCQYWIGESYYGLGNYQQAIVAFQKVFSFTNTNKDTDAQLKLGLCFMKLKDYEKAKLEFQKLIDNYPTSDLVSSARRFMAQLE